MESHIGTNLVTWLVIFPVMVVVAGGIIWYIVRIKGALVKRVTMIVGGFFAFIGFSVILLGVYYHLNPAFAGGFRFYAYSALAPDGNPFQISEGGYGPVLLMNEVYTKDGQTKLLSSFRPDLPKYVYVFTSGKYIYTKIDDDVLTIQPDVAGSESNITKTSLWWALTKDLYKLNSSGGVTRNKGNIIK